MPQSERDVTKLPKWAQRRIASLEVARDVLAAEAEAGPEDSNTFADPHGYPKPLGKNERIQFVIGKDEREGRADRDIEIHARVSQPDYKGRCSLELYGSNGALLVRPSSTNVLHVLVDLR